MTILPKVTTQDLRCIANTAMQTLFRGVPQGVRPEKATNSLFCKARKAESEILAVPSMKAASFVHLAAALALLPVCAVFSAEKYANPALNPVTFHPAPAGKPLTLIRGGSPDFAIVCDLTAEKGGEAKKNHITRSRRSVTLALEGLQHALNSVCGKKAPVLKPDSPRLGKYACLIVLGDNPLSRKLGFDPARLTPDEFRVFTFEKGVVIAGFDGSSHRCYDTLDPARFRINGTAYGVYDFCERFLGMRYYYPNMGIYAPKVRDLVIEPVSYSDKPQLKFHYSYALSAKNVPGEQQLSDFSPAWRNGTSSRFLCSHTPEPRALARAYPDKIDMLFFRSRAGRLYFNPRAHIGSYYDITNPEFIDFFVDELAAKFYAGDAKVRRAWGSSALPNSEYVPFGQADTYVSDLVNERSKAYLPESTKLLRHGSLSDLYAHFNIALANRLKQRFPDKKLATSAYSSRTLPPVLKYDWPDNLRLKLCMGCPVMVRSELFRKAWKSVSSGWRRITGRPVAGYSYGVKTYVITRTIEGRYMGEFIRNFGDDLWNEHLFFDAGGHDNRFYCSYYPAYRSMWNSDFNVRAALDEHWDLLYGPEAGKHLKAFYDLLVERWENVLIPSITKVSADYAIRGSVTPQELYKAYDRPTIDRLAALLAEARRAVRPGSIEEKRLNYFAEPWKNQFETAKAGHAATVPLYRVRRLDPGETITVDGRADEPAWRRADVCPMRDSCGVDRDYPEKPQCRMLWDVRGIYLFFSALGKPADNPGEIWKYSDALEYFLSPGLRKKVFYQFAFNPNGDLYQGTKDLVDGTGGLFECAGLQLSSRYDEKGWQAEVFIPFSGMHVPAPRAYDVWFGNAVYAQRRSTTDKNIAASFALTMRDTHNVGLWGQFKFMGRGD